MAKAERIKGVQKTRKEYTVVMSEEAYDFFRGNVPFSHKGTPAEVPYGPAEEDTIVLSMTPKEAELVKALLGVTADARSAPLYFALGDAGVEHATECIYDTERGSQVVSLAYEPTKG